MTELIYDNPEVWEETECIYVCPSTLEYRNWIVTSRTDPLVNYMVFYSFANGYSCECKAYTYGLDCWHIEFAKGTLCIEQGNAVPRNKHGDGICACGEKLSVMEAALNVNDY